MSEKLLKINKLNKHFGGLHAVSNVSFDVLKGQIKAIIGPNGAGKTTLMNLISEVTAVSIPDTPGALGNLLSIMEHAGLNLEYMYAFVEKNMDQAIIIFRFDDTDKAIEVLSENDIDVIDEEKLLTI